MVPPDLAGTQDLTVDDYGTALAPHHAQLLLASAISPEVAEARGYRTAYTKADLGRLGFGRAAQSVPALVLPVHSVTGDVVGDQIRADEPRYVGERVVKYETPARFKMRLDVPPAVREHLDDPHRVLVITEGIRKADAAVSRGIDAVDLLGVYGFRGTNGKGGRTALPDLQLIAWNGRTVLVAFDSDVVLKEGVRAAMVELGALLTHYGATVSYIYLPSAPGGVKVGLDDYLAADTSRGIDELQALSQSAPRPAIPTTPALPPPIWDGQPVLPALREALRHYVAFPDEHTAVAVALWIVSTWLTEVFYTSPRLSVQSPELGSGKTRLLEVVRPLCRNGRLWTNASVAALFRSIAKAPITVLLDEVDNVFTARNDPEKGDLRGLLNEGYRKGASVPRCVGANRDEVEEFAVYAPVAMAGLGACLPDTLVSRSLVIPMRRRRPDEPVAPYREREASSRLEPLAEQVHAWAAWIVEEVKDRVPRMPAGVTDRAADCWEPLLAIAEVAGPAEATMAREACASMVAATATASRSLSVLLLDSIRTVFTAKDVEHQYAVPAIHTDELLTALWALEDAPWINLHGEALGAIRLAQLLKPYGIVSDRVDLGDGRKRGYRRCDLEDAWARYLDAPILVSPPEPVQPVQPVPRTLTATPIRDGLDGLAEREGHEGSDGRDGLDGLDGFQEDKDQRATCHICGSSEDGLLYIAALSQWRCERDPPEFLLTNREDTTP